MSYSLSILVRRPRSGPLLTGLRGRSVSLAAVYWACYAVVLALLPLGGVLNWTEIAVGLALQLALGLTLAFGGPLRYVRSRFAGVLGIACYLCSVALLRDGAAAAAGFGPLVLLPVLWASLRAGRAELAAAVAGVAAVYLLPEVLAVAPDQPAGEWRAAVLYVLLSAAIGISGRQLVDRNRALVARLEELARTDELTGLPNRRAWSEMFQHELAAARRSGQPLTMALLDLDGFKGYNDTHGHLAGDQLLVQAAEAWRRELRDTDVLARWGGDEFGLLLPACDAEQAETLVARMDESCPPARFSVGIAEWDGQSSPDQALAVADQALYSAKRAGRSEGETGLATIPRPRQEGHAQPPEAEHHEVAQ